MSDSKLIVVRILQIVVPHTRLRVLALALALSTTLPSHTLGTVANQAVDE